MFFNYDVESGDNCGIPVSISNKFLIVGCYDCDVAGCAFIYTLNETETDTSKSWIFHSKLIPDVQSTNSRFGISLSITDKYVIIGAFQENSNADYDRAAYIFEYDSISDNWTQIEKFIPPHINWLFRFRI